MAKYNDPLVLGRADPYVYKHTDGYYYFTATYPAYDRILHPQIAHDQRADGCAPNARSGINTRRA